MRYSALHWSACLGLGAVAAILGLLPWLVTGGELPLQNLWAVETLPGEMPFALLPFSQYAIFLLLGLIGTGFAAAGLVVRCLGARVTRAGGWATWGGALVVYGIAAIQTAAVVSPGLRDDDNSSRYLAAVLVVVAISASVGTLAFWLIARAPVPGAVIGLAIGAICFGNWVSGFTGSFSLFPYAPVTEFLRDVLRWAPAVLIGAAIAWGGLRSVGRWVAAAVALVVLWVQLPLSSAISSATSRVLLRYPEEMLEQGLGVLRMAAGMWEVTMPPVVVALVVAGVGLVARWLVARRGSGKKTSGIHGTGRVGAGGSPQGDVVG